MMRDLGYNYCWYDKYAKPLLIKGFEWAGEPVAAMTLFEVFEHYTEPINEVNNLLQISDTIIFTTELYDKGDKWKNSDWWYYSQDGGQHIMFYSEKTFDFLAKKFMCNYYNLGGIMILTKLKISKFKIMLLRSKLINFYVKLKLIMFHDYRYSLRDMEYLQNMKKQ